MSWVGFCWDGGVRYDLFCGGGWLRVNLAFCLGVSSSLWMGDVERWSMVFL